MNNSWRRLFNYRNGKVLVIGLGLSGRASALLLRRLGISTYAFDDSTSDELRKVASELDRQGVKVFLGRNSLDVIDFDFAVLSPGVPTTSDIVLRLKSAGVPVLGEIEFAWRLCCCPIIAITGTNGKTTTTELVEKVLLFGGRRAIAAGNIGLPVSSVVEKTRNLDWLVLEVSSFQLETIEFFRPTIAILTNITPDHFDRYSGMEEYIKAKVRVFENQLSFDWAVIEINALKLLRKHGYEIPSRIVTYSAADKSCDIFLDSSWVKSRFNGDREIGLINVDQCQLKGPHNIENIMAALAVARILQLPFQEVADAILNYRPAEHRCELVMEIDGIQFINDSKATNVDAVAKALMTVRKGLGNRPNVWLIAGGKDKGFGFDEICELLVQRVKGVVLIGETSQKIQSVWSKYVSCIQAENMLEAVFKAAENAVDGDVVLLSPACSSFDMFRDYRHRGEAFRKAVELWCKSRLENNKTKKIV